MHELFCEIHKKVLLDGNHIGLLHKSKNSLFTHELMFNILSHLCGGESFHQYYTGLVDAYHVTLSTPPSQSLLREAWSGFLDLLQVENSSCSHCQNQPKIIICDGITLSCRKEEIPLEESTSEKWT